MISPGEERWSGVSGIDGPGGEVLTKSVSFRIASITKTFTATAVMRLTEMGALALDDSVSKFLEAELVDRLCSVDEVSFGGRITLRHLLQHTAGIYSLDNLSMEELRPGRMWPYRSPRAQVEFAISQGAPYGPPGSLFRYSDIGYVLVALILETVTELSLSEAFRRLLRFEDLGLRTIHLELMESTPPGSGRLMRHFLRDVDYTGFDPMIDQFGCGGLVCNTADLASWWHGLFQGEILALETLRQMQQTIEDASSGWRIGLGLFARAYGEQTSWYHSGAWGSFALHLVPSGSTIVASTNQSIDACPAAFEGLRASLVEAVTHSP